LDVQDGPVLILFENMLATAMCYLNLPSLTICMSNFVKFIGLIKDDVNQLPFLIIPMPLYQLIHQRIIVLESMRPEDRKLQLKWIRESPILLDQEVCKLASEYSILYRFVITQKSSVAEVIEKFCRKSATFSVAVADSASEITEMILKSVQLDFNA
jgi:hypothetical protein